MRLLIFFIYILVSTCSFGQKTRPTNISGLLLLEEIRGHVYEGYFLPKFSETHFKELSSVDTISGFSVAFLYGCVPDNNELRNELRKSKLLDSLQVISTIASSQGQEFLDSTKLFFMNGSFKKTDLTDNGRVLWYTKFQIKGKIFVLALKGRCTSRNFLFSKGRVSS